MSVLDRFDRSNVKPYRNTAGAVVNLRSPAYADLLRETVDMLMECAKLCGLDTPTPPAVEVAGIKGSINIALIPQPQDAPAFFRVIWGSDTRRASINLYEYFVAKNITIPSGEYWRVPMSLQTETGDAADGVIPHLVLHLDQRTVQATNGRAGEESGEQDE